VWTIVRLAAGLKRVLINGNAPANLDWNSGRVRLRTCRNVDKVPLFQLAGYLQWVTGAFGDHGLPFDGTHGRRSGDHAEVL